MSYNIAQNQSGPLPQKIPFTVPIDGDVTLAFSGTCWSTAANSLGGLVVYLDGTALGKVTLFFNSAGQHLALPTLFFPITLTDGPHTITLVPLTPNTTSDENDFFSLWIID